MLKNDLTSFSDSLWAILLSKYIYFFIVPPIVDVLNGHKGDITFFAGHLQCGSQHALPWPPLSGRAVDSRHGPRRKLRLSLDLSR